MKFDQILISHIGECGKYQIQVIAIVCIREIFSALHNMGVVFLAATPVFLCENEQFDINPKLKNCSLEEKSNLTSPWDIYSKQIDYCLIYDGNFSQLESCTFNKTATDLLGNVTKDCTIWDYDTSQHAGTLTTEVGMGYI